MNKQLVMAIMAPVAIGATAGLSSPSMATTTDAAVRLSTTCDTAASTPTLMLTFAGENRLENVPMLSFLPKYFSPQQAVQNCQDAAETLQGLYQNDSVQYLVSDRIGTQPVICAVERRGVGCNHYNAQILLTLDQTTDPNLALYDMLGSEFKQSEPPASRTVGRMYADIERPWGAWLQRLF